MALWMGARKTITKWTDLDGLGRTRTDSDGLGRIRTARTARTDRDGPGRTRTDPDGPGRTGTDPDRPRRTQTDPDGWDPDGLVLGLPVELLRVNLSVEVAIEDGTSLVVEGQRVLIPTGWMAVWRGDLCHQGDEYDDIHTRLHVYLDPLGSANDEYIHGCGAKG
jgi:hypothetical protein